MESIDGRRLVIRVLEDFNSDKDASFKGEVAYDVRIYRNEGKSFTYDKGYTTMWITGKFRPKLENSRFILKNIK